MVYFDREGCTRSMNHDTDSKAHETDKRCKYQHQFENKVFLCKVGSQRDLSSHLYIVWHLFNSAVSEEKPHIHSYFKSCLFLFGFTFNHYKNSLIEVWL